MLVKLKKSNAILEYGVILAVVVGAMAGISFYLKRHIQARVKNESDRLLGHGQGLEWEAKLSFNTAGTDTRRIEEKPANFEITHDSSSTVISYVPAQPPYVMEHKGSSQHVQDAPMQPPNLDYPDQETHDYEDNGERQ